MYDGRDGLRVWAHTGDRAQWEVSLMEMPRSVESSWIEEGRARGWTYGGCNGLRWVCTYGTSHPGRWSAQGIGRYCLWNVWVYVWNWKGLRKSTPVESSGIEVDRELRTSGQTEYGTTCLGRMGRYIGRDALGIRRGKLPRSTICEMQARNRLLEYANCVSMALDVLAGRFKYYSWRSCKMRYMCL